MAKKNSKKKNRRTKLQKSQDRLISVYNSIPDTKGCMANISEGEKCRSWCCALQNPQVLTCEFFYVWEYVYKNWSYEDIIVLVESCLKAYLSNRFNKSCVFWDNKTKLCKIHKRRPFNCHIYGITPHAEIQLRINRLKGQHSTDPLKQVRNQCHLVSTENGEEVTSKMIQAWWNKLLEIEQSLGFKKREITDGFGGGYRTYHDHFLIRLLSEDVLSNLSSLRTYGDEGEKSHFVYKFIKSMKDNARSMVGDLARV